MSVLFVRVCGVISNFFCTFRMGVNNACVKIFIRFTYNNGNWLKLSQVWQVFKQEKKCNQSLIQSAKGPTGTRQNGNELFVWMKLLWGALVESVCLLLTKENNSRLFIQTKDKRPNKNYFDTYGLRRGFLIKRQKNGVYRLVWKYFSAVWSAT